MKKTFLLLLALGLLMALIPAASATETPHRTRYQCGEYIYWAFDETTGTLTIGGEGLMDDFGPGEAPWYSFKDDITTVVFGGGVSYVGSYSFYDFDSITQVDFGDSMYELGEGSFYSCDGLTTIELPRTFKVFGPDSLRQCKNLTHIYCDGGFPSFRLNALWDTYAYIIYPADRPWGLEYIQQLEDAFKGRIEFIDSNGKDHYVPEGEEETVLEPTEPEQTLPPVTLPVPTETDPPVTETEPPVTETEPPVTEPLPPIQPTPTETEPTQTVPFPTQTEPVPTQPEQPEPKPSMSMTPLIILGVVAAFLMLGTGIALYRSATRKRY